MALTQTAKNIPMSKKTDVVFMNVCLICFLPALSSPSLLTTGKPGKPYGKSWREFHLIFEREDGIGSDAGDCAPASSHTTGRAVCSHPAVERSFHLHGEARSDGIQNP